MQFMRNSEHAYFFPLILRATKHVDNRAVGNNYCAQTVGKCDVGKRCSKAINFSSKEIFSSRDEVKLN